MSPRPRPRKPPISESKTAIRCSSPQNRKPDGMRRVLTASLLSAVLAVSALAQTCNSMTGNLNCGGPSGFLPGVGEGLYGNSGRSGNLPPVSTLGGDLTGSDRP